MQPLLIFYDDNKSLKHELRRKNYGFLQVVITNAKFINTSNFAKIEQKQDHNYVENCITSVAKFN